MEETVKSKQFDVCQTLWHSVQSATLVQTLVGVKMKLFRVEINLSACNNSQLFFENAATWKLNIADENSTIIIQRFNINKRNLTTKSNRLNMEKWTNTVLQEFRKDCAIFNQQKCKLHKPGRPNINFGAITLNF